MQVTVRPTEERDLDDLLDLYESVAAEGKHIGAEVVMGLLLG